MLDALAKFFSSPRKGPAPPEAAFVIKLEGREFTSRLPGFDWEGGMITSGESACLWRSNGS